MHDGIERIPINKLNFEQLRERVQILQDRYDMLLRRFPQLASGSSDFEIDWANIRTPLINAIVNRIKFTAKQNYEDMGHVFDIEHRPGSDNNDDKESMYIYEGECWWFDSVKEVWKGGAIFPDKTRIYVYKGVNYRRNIIDTLAEQPYPNKQRIYFHNGMYWYYKKADEEIDEEADEEIDEEVDEEADEKGAWFSTNELYWYWNGNEWVATANRDIYSEFKQMPSGFSLKGILELFSDTDGRLTISDSFIKMYPAGTDNPKIQFGYDNSSENNNPVILLGEGVGNTTVPINDIFGIDHVPGDGEDKKRVYCYEGVYWWYREEPGSAGTWTYSYDRNFIPGYPVRYAQGIITKTAYSIIVGMVSDSGVAKTLELRANNPEAGLYYVDGGNKYRIDMNLSNESR